MNSSSSQYICTGFSLRRAHLQYVLENKALRSLMILQFLDIRNHTIQAGRLPWIFLGHLIADVPEQQLFNVRTDPTIANDPDAQHFFWTPLAIQDDLAISVTNQQQPSATANDSEDQDMTTDD